MITIDDTAAGNSDPVQQAVEVIPCIDYTPCTDDIAATILSDAKRSAQSELRSTSETLKLAGSVLPLDRAGSSGGICPIIAPIAFSSKPKSTIEIALRDHGGTERKKSLMAAPSVNPSMSSSPRPSPPQSPTIDDSIHLPGKFGSLSFAQVKQKLAASPVKQTELLSKLDGLDRLIPSSTSIRSSYSKEVSDELTGSVVKSRSTVSAAMVNAHAHANRIKKNPLVKRCSRGTSIGNSKSFESSSHSSTLSLTSLANDQSLNPPGSAKTLCGAKKMPLWVQRKIAAETGKNVNNTERDSEYFGQYEIHSSETIITHEFNRGDWTWTTEWSPDGNFLALATENHGLAIVEAGMSTHIWKVVHDERIGKVKNDTTHTIRSIAWGGNFIALGGTGDAVSIVEPCLSLSCSEDGSTSSSGSSQRYSFDVVDIITETGFVGALSWLKCSNILAIGNREDQCLIAEIRRGEVGTVTSNILHNIERSDWVTAVKFNFGGTKLAIGDRSGLLSVYLFVMIRHGKAPALSPLQDIRLDETILDIQWSPEGKYLYTGGEDYSITILDTAKYSILHQIGRDRWVTFLAPSRGGSYLAAGGECHHVSLLDVGKKWEHVTSLPVEGITLCAAWHPKDEYLAVCGQFNDVVVYESSSCQGLPEGKCLRSKSSILAIEFSPDGIMIAVGTEIGLVTVFDALSPTFVTLYETVIGSGGDMAIKWSPNGNYIAIASGSTFVLLDTSYSGKAGMHPQSLARFLVRKVIQNGASFTSLTFSPSSQFLALSGDQATMVDVKDGCSCIRVLDQSNVISSAWSKDGSVFATVGSRSDLLIYDVKSSSPSKWGLLFSISFKSMITSLCWGPSVKKGLQYLAFGGGTETVAILEVRTHEKIWETVLQIPFPSTISTLDWNDRGMLCVGDDNGTVSLLDVSYLKRGIAVSEMSYNWQRQGVISITKFTRNHGRNAITSLCWIPSSKVLNNHISLAIGGSDGVFEIVNLFDCSQPS